MKKFFPFVSLGYSFTQEIFSHNDNEISGNRLILGAGISYMITSNVALEKILCYSFDKRSMSESYLIYYSELEINSNVFKIGVGSNIFLC